MVFISRYLTDAEVRGSLEHYAKLLDQREEALDRREVELRQQSDQRVALLNQQEESLRRREEVLVAKGSEKAEGKKSKGQQGLQAPPPQRTLLQRQPNFREMAAAVAARRVDYAPSSSSSRVVVVGGEVTGQVGAKDKKSGLARMQKTLGRVPNVMKVAAGGVSKESKKTLKRGKPQEPKPSRDDRAVGEGSPKKRRHLPFNAFFSANSERFREEASRHVEMGARAAIRLAAQEWSQLDDKSQWMKPKVAATNNKSGSGEEGIAGNE